MRKTLFVLLSLVILLSTSIIFAEEDTDKLDFYTGIGVVGPQKSLTYSEKEQAFNLKNKALSALPMDEKWEARDLLGTFNHKGFAGMTPGQAARLDELVEKASTKLSPEEKALVTEYGKKIRAGEGK